MTQLTFLRRSGLNVKPGSLPRFNEGSELARDAVFILPFHPDTTAIEKRDNFTIVTEDESHYFDRQQGGQFYSTSSFNTAGWEETEYGAFWRGNSTTQLTSWAQVNTGIGSGPFTWGMRFRNHGTPSGYKALGAFGTFNPGLFGNLSGANVWGLYHGTNLPANSQLAVGEIYTVIATKHASGLIEYTLDGRPDGMAVSASSIGAPAFFHPTHSPGSSGSDPDVDWVGFWARAFDEGERQALCDAFWPELFPEARRVTYFFDAAVGPTPVSRPQTLQWNLNALVDQPLDLRWEVLSTMPVDRAQAFQWQLRQDVLGTPLDLFWQLREEVQRAADFRWALRESITNSLELRWQLREAIDRSFTLQWSIGDITFVSRPVTLEWAMRESVNADSDIRWALREIVPPQGVDLRWQLRQLTAGLPLDLFWQIKGLAERDLTLQWALPGDVSNTLEIQWQLGGVPIPRDPSYILEIRHDDRTLTILHDDRTIKILSGD